jgi:SAM-dependent methyltransferase
MDDTTVEHLLKLNRDFYVVVGDLFDQTRMSIPPGMTQALEHLPELSGETPLRLLDVGCGNGRLAWALDALSRTVEYTGVDADSTLLAHARHNVAGLDHVHSHIVQADLAQRGWTNELPDREWDAVFCLATLHHLPGRALRKRVITEMAQMLSPNGRLVVSAWQFDRSPRLRSRRLPWSLVGLDSADVDAGDALLPWDQGVHSVRYVAHIDEAEIRSHAQATDLDLVTTFDADGKEGALNLYAVLQRKPKG